MSSKDDDGPRKVPAFHLRGLRRSEGAFLEHEDHLRRVVARALFQEHARTATGEATWFPLDRCGGPSLSLCA